MRLASQLVLGATPAAPLAATMLAAGEPGRTRPAATFAVAATALVAAPLLAAALTPAALPSHLPSRVAFGVILMSLVVPAGFAVLMVAIDGVVCRSPAGSLVAASPSWMLGAAAGYALGSAVALRHPRALAWAWPLAVATGVLCGLLVAAQDQPCRPDS